MRVLLIGDIHSNLEALRQVLDHAHDNGGFHSVWCLGDIVGYGPDPIACLDIIRDLTPTVVAGNHDRAAAGLIPIDTFNEYAAEACRWTTRSLDQGHIDYLKALPLSHTEGSFTMVHGSLRDPVWEYLVDQQAALATFGLLETGRCLVAHSHIPFVCRESEDGPQFERLPEGVATPLGQGRTIVNPGSVGQPRDGDPRAAYILLDTGLATVTLHRISYDIPTTQEKMARADLPAPLIDRLSLGR